MRAAPLARGSDLCNTLASTNFHAVEATCTRAQLSPAPFFFLLRDAPFSTRAARNGGQSTQGRDSPGDASSACLRGDWDIRSRGGAAVRSKTHKMRLGKEKTRCHTSSLLASRENERESRAVGCSSISFFLVFFFHSHSVRPHAHRRHTGTAQHYKCSSHAKGARQVRGERGRVTRRGSCASWWGLRQMRAKRDFAERKEKQPALAKIPCSPANVHIRDVAREKGE